MRPATRGAHHHFPAPGERGLPFGAEGGIRTHTGFYSQGILSPQCLPFHHLGLEAPVGIEPTYKGFADPCLTIWLRRRINGPKALAQPRPPVRGRGRA